MSGGWTAFVLILFAAGTVVAVRYGWGNRQKVKRADWKAKHEKAKADAAKATDEKLAASLDKLTGGKL